MARLWQCDDPIGILASMHQLTGQSVPGQSISQFEPHPLVVLGTPHIDLLRD